MQHKYKLLECAYSDELSDLVTKYMAQGWDLWGNPFAVEAEYDGNVQDIHYFQAMVRFDPDGHSVVGKIETALREPAGFSISNPETPTADDFRELSQAIAGSGQPWDEQ